MKSRTELLFLLIAFTIFQSGCKTDQPADLILINGKIITVDSKFSIAEAVAVTADRIVSVGTSKKIKKLFGENTRVIDLGGKTVIPGLIESHVHPEQASTSELENKIPVVHNIEQLLAWIKSEAGVKEKGEWIIFPKMFFTRLTELRQPSLAELDNAAPDNPVFLNGSYGGMINTAAMKASGIAGNENHPGILKDKKSGLATGFIQASAFGLLKIPARKSLSPGEKQAALQIMLNHYNRYAITSIFSGSGSFETVRMLREMRDKNILTTRVFQNIGIRPRRGITKEAMSEMMKAFKEKTGDGDNWVRIGSAKIVLDGGILTGTALLSEPWGDKALELFGIDDPGYKGVVNYSREDLVTIVSAVNEYEWSFTAHATGGGAVNLLLDVFNEVNAVRPIKERRFSIIHGNFFDDYAVRLMKELGVYANVQSAWFYKDADAMENILGSERIKKFHPFRTMIDNGIVLNGGSDHMVKLDANEGINPYNPFLAMWTAVTRTTERGSVIGLNEAVTREEALKMYTINNAYASFAESIKGSIEPGKLADLAVLSNDLLNCQLDEIRNIESVLTFVGGQVVYSSGP